MLAGFGLEVEPVDNGSAMPGSYWGDTEAGLVGSVLFVHDDTPLHSAQREACRIVCMDDARRARLHADAGGDAMEKDAVCYLQAPLAGRITGYDRYRLFTHVDA